MPNEVLQRSVTRDDYAKNPKSAVFNFFFSPGFGRLPLGLPASPPRFWSRKRDDVLYSTVHFESMWADSVYIAITKMASMAWKVRGPRLRAQRLREILLGAGDGRGWVPFFEKFLKDFLLRDNGAFVEIVRATEGAASRIVGIIPLDSSRCLRTGDPDIPVVYQDRLGRWHELQDYQVMSMADMPESMDSWFGIGQSAASRAYPAIYTLYALEQYVSEKITGRRPLSLNFVNNIDPDQLQSATAQAQAQQENKGYVSFMGAVVIPMIDPESAPQVATIQLAGLPEGWTASEERRKAYLVYANALGIDPQEVDPQLLASRALGTGAQARVIDDKASGKGLVAARQDFIQQVMENLAPEETTFFFSERDWRDQLQQENVKSIRTQTIVAQIQAGMITPEMGTQLLVDSEDLPPEFLIDPDKTPVEEISSDEVPRLYLPAPQGEKPKVMSNGVGEAGLGTRDTYSPANKDLADVILESKWEVVQKELNHADAG